MAKTKAKPQCREGNRAKHVTIAIPNERIRDLLSSAWDSGCGCGYWARLGEEKGVDEARKDLGEEWTESWAPRYWLPLSEFGSIEVEEFDDGKKVATHVLDLKALNRGLAAMAEKYGRHFGDFIAESGDAVTADVFVQCAVFGDVKYG